MTLPLMHYAFAETFYGHVYSMGASVTHVNLCTEDIPS